MNMISLLSSRREFPCSLSNFILDRLDLDRQLQDPERSEPNHYPSHEIRLYLFQVSTGKLHLEAQQPIISVMNTRWEKPAVGIEIVGDNLVLILAYYEHPHKPDDQVFVYEWRTGKLKMVRKKDPPFFRPLIHGSENWRPLSLLRRSSISH